MAKLMNLGGRVERKEEQKIRIANAYTSPLNLFSSQS
jgi:hypothetical protein